MRLFIAEKPSLGKAIAEGIGTVRASRTHIECKGGAIVTWCFGHLLEQAEPEDYSPIYKKWRADDLPIIPERWKLIPKKTSLDQFKAIKELLQKASEVVNAGDPDREGQLLVDELLEYVGNKKPVRRIWLASLDEKSVAKALANLRDNQDYQNLKNSALTRQRADWLVGMNLTRAMTLAAQQQGVKGVISAGRVQTPTLALVVDRDREIEKFVPRDFYVPIITVAHAKGTFTATWQPGEDSPGLDPDGRLLDRNVADAVARKAKGQSGNLSQVQYQEKRKAPPLPYNLAKLTKAASSKYGFSAADTLEYAQALYESKLTTYPRSDCQYLPDEQFSDAAEILRGLASSGVPGAQKANPSIRTGAWSTAKVTAHHAIIPTGKPLERGVEAFCAKYADQPNKARNIANGMRKLYSLICESYIRQFYPDMRYVSQQAMVDLAGEKWKATGQQIIDPGWTVLGGHQEDDEEQDPGGLPLGMKQGDGVRCQDVQVRADKTKPPPRFTDGSLVEAMANIHKFVTNPEIKKRLKETSGIGTDATRGNIIETLFTRTYLERKGKQIISTKLGREVVDRIPQNLRDPGTTALWEDALAMIAEGKVTAATFMGKQTEQLPRMVKAALEAKFSDALAGPVHPCPACSKPLRRFQSRTRKGSYFWACSEKDHPLLMDEKGKPGAPFGERKANDGPKAPCPEAKCKEMMSRRESKTPGFFFWTCPNQKHPLRKDDNGKPGEPMVFNKQKAKGSSKGAGQGSRRPK